jgi:hypothetical protein
MWHRIFLVVLFVASVASMSCSEDDIIEAAAGDPVPAGMGTLASIGVAAGVTAITDVVNQVAVAGSGKPSLKAAPAGVVVGVFPEEDPECDAGTADITGTAPDFTATFTGCQSGLYTVTGTATINVPSARPN